MAHALDSTSPQPAVDTSKLRDEIYRLSQRLVRARESYDQDLFGGDAEVPLDVQLSVIESYVLRLESLNEQVRQQETGAQVPSQPSRAAAPQPAPVVQQVPAPRAAEPAPAPVRRPAIPGPGITNPDGTPLVSDGSLIRTEEGAIGEYLRYAAEQRWVAATRQSNAAGYSAVCELLLAALAHKHGVDVEEERQSLVRHVDARYRRDYG
ncbi:hypothetical protein [Cellulomonas rhizosphaerae]|uniref:hypothetical protein n=1 Tax=Cellulomonas rhizosphaerae TaxID=2293719 RepID=UPI0018F6CDE3|nr:hypothetical protein [Cellulomonas rhizosphaerae]